MPRRALPPPTAAPMPHPSPGRSLRMVATPDSIDQLTQVISHVIAPAFMLGAVTSFVSIVTGRIDVVLGRIRNLNAIPSDDLNRAHLKEDVQRLSRRLVLLRRCMLL